jgi:hypothetical protein
MNVMSSVTATRQKLSVECWSHNALADLAGVYRESALALLDDEHRRKQGSRGPARLLALHAIELYLTALLLARGHEATDIRDLQHDLAARAVLATQAGLVLRRLTAEHLQALARNREYLVTRYHPEAAGQLSELNRLKATLDEIAVKVSRLLDCA